jgi:two-component system cell cycle sensor histidine kinase PleC
MGVVMEESVELDRGAVAPHGRRAVALKMREVRERLTSTNGLRPAFDQELARQFAQNRLTAAPVVLALVLGVAGAASLWTNGLVITIWLLSMIFGQGMMVLLARRFLASTADSRGLKRWRLRFSLGEVFTAACWATLGLHLSTVNHEAANVFVLFLMMLIIAVSTMLSATIPMVMYLGAIPICGVIVGSSLLSGTVTGSAISIMAAAALAYFMVRQPPSPFGRGDARVSCREGRAHRRARAGQGELRRGQAAG